VAEGGGTTGPSGRSDRVPGEYLVTLRGPGDEATVRRALAPHVVREVRDLGRGRFLVRLADDPGLDTLRRDALASGEVVDVQPNYIYRKSPRR
jgi:hypothetical protein